MSHTKASTHRYQRRRGNLRLGKSQDQSKIQWWWELYILTNRLAHATQPFQHQTVARGTITGRSLK